MKPTDKTSKSNLTAAGLLDSLLASGTPADKLATSRAWLREHRTATAQEMYGFLETQKPSAGGRIGEGTLLKAGKMLYGEDFVLPPPGTSAATLPAQTEEITQLREELATALRDLAQANKRGVALQRQMDHITAKTKEAEAHILRIHDARNRRTSGTPGVTAG